jgi:hypothetical protein
MKKTCGKCYGLGGWYVHGYGTMPNWVVCKCSRAPKEKGYIAEILLVVILGALFVLILLYK